VPTEGEHKQHDESCAGKQNIDYAKVLGNVFEASPEHFFAGFGVQHKRHAHGEYQYSAGDEDEPVDVATGVCGVV
jgi:hypothetical protein